MAVVVYLCMRDVCIRRKARDEGRMVGLPFVEPRYHRREVVAPRRRVHNLNEAWLIKERARQRAGAARVYYNIINF